jgi:hypothetical protein
VSKVIALYPTIDDNLRNKLIYETGDYQFSYNNPHYKELKTQLLDVNKTASLIKFEDPDFIWDPEVHNFRINRRGEITNPHFLFGENGVVPYNSELAIGLIWSSKAVNIRGAKILKTFTAGTERPLKIDFELDFTKGTVKQELYLEMIVYVNRAGDERSEENHLCNTPGSIVGKLESSKIVLEGNGSVFPIVEVDEDTMPLWWVVCSWTDIQEDKFDVENVKICINKGHSNFDQVYSSNKLGNSPLFLEILGSALQTIIANAKESPAWDNVKNGDGLVPGSVGEAINYFINTFNWDASSPENLNRTIREYLEYSM